jgi:hemin uptake protein HemP
MMTGGADGRRLAEDDAAQAVKPASTGVAAARPALRRVASVALLAGAREIEIEHRGELYRLRCTHKGKLILTK